MGLVRAQFEEKRKGDTKNVLASPSCSHPGSAEPQRRRSSRPKRTPHALGAASSPWVHRRGNPPPARPPDSSPPSLCAGSGRRGAPAAVMLPPPWCSRINRPLGKRAPPSEGDRGGCGAGEWRALGNTKQRVRARSQRDAKRQCASVRQWRRRALRRADGRFSSSSAPLYFFADSWASGFLQGSFFRGAQKLANGPR